MRRLGMVLAALTVILLAAAGCGDEESDDLASDAAPGDTIVLWSGLPEDMLGPLVERFENESGVDVEPTYGNPGEMARSLQIGGGPADVFISPSPTALGVLAAGDRLTSLADNLLAVVADGFRGTNGRWVGITGRVRVLVHDEDAVDELPDSVLDLADAAFAGRVAVAPTSGSFRDFVVAMRVELGDDETSAWLEGMAANDAPVYADEAAIVAAVGRGEVDMGLVDHSVTLREVAADPTSSAVNHAFASDGWGSPAIVTGGAVPVSSTEPDAGAELLAFLLGADAQTMLVEQTAEYALAVRAPVRGPEGAPELDATAVDVVDAGVTADALDGTIEMIAASGIEQ